jgi:NitT/TauT family transport system permease protein
MRPSSLTRPWTAPIWVALGWLVVVPLFGIKARYLPALPAVLGDGWSVGPDLLAGFWRTLVETVLGFLLGSAFGLLCGVVFASVRIIERAVFPLFVALQTIPVIAFGAIVVTWFGNTILAKVVIAFFLTCFPVAVDTLGGLQACDPQRLALLRSFGGSRPAIFRMLALPTAAPDIMVGLKLGVSLSLAGAIVGEWFGDTVGLGVMLLQALYFEQVPRLWVLVIATGIMGTLLYAVLTAFERRFVWWRTS